MDYRKEYEEAVKRAMAMIKVAEKEDEVYKCAITIFPELKESEDDRIMKTLIDYFRWNTDSQLLNEFTNREVFACLEKFSEQNLIMAKSSQLGGQKSAWSEKDEEYINDLIGVFDGQQHQAHSDEEIVNWLKTLKNNYV